MRRLVIIPTYNEKENIAPLPADTGRYMAMPISSRIPQSRKVLTRFLKSQVFRMKTYIVTKSV